MTSDQFAYWLQGFAELNAEPPSAEQWQAIREHLALVFNKVTPPIGLRPDKMPPAVPYRIGDPNIWTPPLRADCVVVSDPNVTSTLVC